MNNGSITKVVSSKTSKPACPLPNNRSLVKAGPDLFLPVTCTAHCTNLFLELVELGDVVEEGGDDGGEQEELFGREVLEGVHDGEVPLDRHGPAE